jgi:hypothetical protein
MALEVEARFRPDIEGVPDVAARFGIRDIPAMILLSER